ncbi:MAG: hypothetical protein ACPKPY_01440 [Nitrososphaeraceae archaeon]
MRQIVQILFLILAMGIMSCSEKDFLENGYYFSVDEPYYLFRINNDTLIFENPFGVDTFTYLLENGNKMILSPINLEDSIIKLDYYGQPDGFKLFIGDSLMKFNKTAFNNVTDFYLNSKGYQINVPDLDNPQFIVEQNLVVTLFVAMQNDSLKMSIDENLTDINNLKFDFQSAIDKYEDLVKPLLILIDHLPKRMI